MPACSEKQDEGDKRLRSLNRLGPQNKRDSELRYTSRGTQRGRETESERPI